MVFKYLCTLSETRPTLITFPELVLNSYRDQFALLAEATAKEREEVTIREKAQNQVSRYSST